MEEELCRVCGEPADDGEGWDGMCGPCADKSLRMEAAEAKGDAIRDERE